MVKWNFIVNYNTLITLPHPMTTARRLFKAHSMLSSNSHRKSFFSFCKPVNHLSLLCLLLVSTSRLSPVETTFPLPIDAYVLRSNLKISFTFFRQSWLYHIYDSMRSYLRLTTRSRSLKPHKNQTECVCPLWRNVDMKVEFWNNFTIGQWMNDSWRVLLTVHNYLYLQRVLIAMLLSKSLQPLSRH